MNKPNKRQEKVFNKMHDILQKDLQRFSKKWLKYPLDEKDEYLRRHIFFMQMRDGMHNVLQVQDTCAHTLNDMIKAAKKDALEYQRDLYKEDK
tara:strand:- start:488 stop:766 length:279 start_codon:yes stop_codon:yes gene_type:complete